MPRPREATVSRQGIFVAAPAVASRASGGRARSALVEDHDLWDMPLSQFAQDAIPRTSPQSPARHDQDAHVGPIEDLPRLLDAQFAQRAHVVDAGGVNEQHRPDGQQLHRLLDRVGGRSRHLGDDGHLLPYQGIEQRRLAGIARPNRPMCRRKDLEAVRMDFALFFRRLPRRGCTPQPRVAQRTLGKGPTPYVYPEGVVQPLRSRGGGGHDAGPRVRCATLG